MKTIIVVSNETKLVNVSEPIKKYIRKVMSLDNPKYIEAQKHGRWTKHLNPVIKLYKDIQDSIIFPRGWTRQCLELLKENGIQFELRDHRRLLNPVTLTFKGQLRSYQEKAVQDIRKRDFGVLEAATGSGKTVIALAVIAKRGQPALILVHTKELLYQWQDKIQEFLGIEAGLIGDGKFEIQPITVGIVNTVRKHLEELPQYFGQVVVDECHRVPSSMFTETVQAFDSKYMLGLSATAYRRDGLTKLIYLTLGDRVYQVNPKELRKSGSVLTPEVIQRQTLFRYKYRDDYQAMMTALTESRSRNLQIVRDVIEQAKVRRGTCLVVSDRVAHCQTLASMIQDYGNYRVRILTGNTSGTEREQIVEDVQNKNVDVLVSTVQLLGEGFDCEGLSSLFLATPIKFKGRLLQVIGRILRPADGKRPVVFDYQDTQVGVLKAQAKARNRALKEITE